MKSLTNILRRSQLTPHERVTALVHNKVQKEKTGKGSLSDAEVRSIAELWTPRGNDEVRRFNKYIALMNLESTMKMEMQMYYCESDNGVLRAHRMIDHMRTYTSLDDFVKQDIAGEHIPEHEGLDFILSHAHLEYEQLVHVMTFNNLDRETQEDLKILDPHIDIDPKYMQQEILLYELLHTDQSLGENTKKELVSLLWNAMYSEKFRKRRDGSDVDGILAHHAFASIPVRQILYVCAEYLSIPVDTNEPKHLNILLQELQDYADAKETSLELIIKPLLATWIDDGLFFSTCIPLYASNGFDTYEGMTQKVHEELFALWYDEFQKTKTYIDELISDGELEKKTYQHSIHGNISVITAKSIYTTEIDIPCIHDVKEQITYLVPLANIFLFIQKSAYPVRSYKTMTAFIELSQEFSKIFDIDLSEKYLYYRDEFNTQILMMNINLLKLMEVIFDLIHGHPSWKYIIELDPDVVNFDINDDVEPDPIVEKYREEMEKNR